MPEHYVQQGSNELFVDVRGDGPALLFAHGIFGTHADGSWLASPAAGFTLIAPDLRGRGRSSPARAVEQHAFEKHALDLTIILNHLNINQVVIIGSSFGAGVAVAFALRYPQQVRALVLIASAFGAQDDPMGEGNLAEYGELGERIAREGLQAVAESESKRTGSSRPLERWTRHDEASVVAWLRAVPIYRPFGGIVDLHRIAHATLVVPGQDKVHTRELSESIARALPRGTLADSGVPLVAAVGEFLERAKRPAAIN